MRLMPFAAVALLLLAGCTSSKDGKDQPLMPANVTPGPEALVAATFAPSVLLGAPPNYGIAGEPSLAVAPDGTYYVSAPVIDLVTEAESVANVASLGHGRVWRSTDGTSFQMLNDANGWLETQKKQAGDGDTDLAVDATGRVHFIDLGAGIPYLTSDDAGKTWQDRGSLSAPSTSVDRQWISARNQTLLVSWRDFTAPSSIRTNRSLDGGETWTPARVTDDDLAGPVVLAPNGLEAYLPFTNGTTDTLEVAVSHDAGLTWSIVDTGQALTQPGTSDPFGGLQTLLFPVLDVDAAGFVHLVWSGYREDGTAELHWLRSSDLGATWASMGSLSAPAGNDIFPWIVAGDAGRIAVTYLTSELAQDPQFGPHQWHLAFTESLDADAAKPSFQSGLVTPDVVHFGAVCQGGSGCGAIVFPLFGDRTLLDFFECAIGPDGSLAVTWTETHEDNGRNPEIHFSHQTMGSKLRAAIVPN